MLSVAFNEWVLGGLSVQKFFVGHSLVECLAGNVPDYPSCVMLVQVLCIGLGSSIAQNVFYSQVEEQII